MREPLIAVSDIPESGSVSADLLGRRVLVTMVNGKPRAYIDVCPHHGGPLVLADDRFTCQWHGSQFEARTGHALSGPVRPDARLIMLPTRVEEGTLVYVYENKESNGPADAGSSIDASSGAERIVALDDQGAAADLG
jgi:nitrite reductase/ring-hydroxylating ferredoxin subunit